MGRGFYEFFAGGGMARAGLVGARPGGASVVQGLDPRARLAPPPLAERSGPGDGDWHRRGAASCAGWECLFANDSDPKKAASYTRNWGAGQLRVGDVAELTANDLPGRADLAWASFPCQDLSLAGAGAGLGGARSGVFWPFWRLMQDLGREDRAPRIIVLENVCGALTSHGGADFAAIGEAIAAAQYGFGAAVIDAAHFLPQSRPRLFVIAAHHGLAPAACLTAPDPQTPWHAPAVVQVFRKLGNCARARWVWWRLPAPPPRAPSLCTLVEEAPERVAWHTEAQTQRLLALMNPMNRAKVEAAKHAGRRMVGSVYKRTRVEAGRKSQRAEVRFDGIAGCLRTPAGGSSRQTILMIDGERVRSRLLSPREAARLMGLSDEYVLPDNYNEAYHLAGDGVAVPVVRFLAEQLLEPLLLGAAATREIAA